MKKIGAGWQTTVYDIGNGKIVKRKISSHSQFLKILFTAGPVALLKGEMKRVNKEIEAALNK